MPALEHAAEAQAPGPQTGLRPAPEPAGAGGGAAPLGQAGVSVRRGWDTSAGTAGRCGQAGAVTPPAGGGTAWADAPSPAPRSPARRRASGRMDAQLQRPPGPLPQTRADRQCRSAERTLRLGEGGHTDERRLRVARPQRGGARSAESGVGSISETGRRQEEVAPRSPGTAGERACGAKRSTCVRRVRGVGGVGDALDRLGSQSGQPGPRDPAPASGRSDPESQDLTS